MVQIIKCDRCNNITENPEKDGFCKILVYEGLGFRSKSRGSKYTHYHFCKECKKELFGKWVMIIM